MSSNYIYALAQRHAAIERKIAEAMKFPSPDILYITSLKKLRLNYRDRIRDAIRDKRSQAATTREWRWKTRPAMQLAQVQASWTKEGF